MVGMNINLLEMGDRGLEYFDVRESHGYIICQCDPQMPAVLGVFQVRLAGRLGQNRRRCVMSEECGGGDLDGCQPRQVARSCRGDSVQRLAPQWGRFGGLPRTNSRSPLRSGKIWSG